ncbi:MAG: glutamate--tRNA ligase [Candidatus Aenigmatarchaeota archaeon]
MEDVIFKHALINAVEHDGKANVQAVIKRVIAENPELKAKIKELIENVKKIVNEVNSLSLEEQKRKLNELDIKIEKKAVKKFELPELPDAEFGKVVTAFPPEPSKYPHIGHAKAAFLNFLYAKKYGGKFILRFEDTNPEMVKEEYYEAIINGLKWLGIEWDKIDYSSDHMEKFYEAVEKLIKEGNAYVCLCKPETIRKNRASKKECKHRMQNVEENLLLWEKMKKDLEEGKGVVRLKIDMKHVNATMRDPSIMRIVETPHPRTRKKYRVWPTYDFGTAMMDGWEGVTHRLRSKEFEVRKELQQYIQKLFGFKPSKTIEFGRLNLEGVETSGRVIREMIKKRKLLGWDDPRLATLMALKKRGFVPEAIKNFILLTGISKAEGIVSWNLLEAENRKVVDPLANRYMVVLNPVEISLENAPEIKDVRINLHPDFPERGFRNIPINTKKIFIEKEDFKKYKNKEVGLMYFGTIKVGLKAKFISKEIPFEIPKIHWCSEPNLKIKIVMPNSKIVEAIGDPGIKTLKRDEIIQMPRVGFARVEKEYKDIILYYSHK